MNKNHRPVTGQSNPSTRTRGSRTSASYWKDRVYRATAKNGRQSPDYSARIEYQGRRVRFPLTMANKEEAAAKAAKIFKYLSQNGWDGALAKFKAPKKAGGTVEVYIEAAERIASLSPRTFGDYAKSLRKIAGEIVGRSSKDPDWKGASGRVSLGKLTSAAIQRWKLDYAASAGSDRMAMRSRMTSANTLIRNARSLFSKKIVKHLAPEFELPSPLPFAEVEFFPRQNMHYVSKIDPRQLIEDARTVLGEDPEKIEQWKIFVLAILCGLRRKEIDLLLWNQIDFDRAVIRIETTKYFKPKAEESAGEVDLDAPVVELFRALRARATSEFVVKGLPPKPEGKSPRYRCNLHQGELIKWLRSWKTEDGSCPLANEQKPIHTLRKECGSLVCAEMGLFAASRFLRHSNTVVTSEFYVDQKGRVTTGLGGLVAT